MTTQTEMFTNTATTGAGHELVGYSIYHGGEHGIIVAFDPDTYAEPMYRVQFGSRVATLRFNEMGAK